MRLDETQEIISRSISLKLIQRNCLKCFNTCIDPDWPKLVSYVNKSSWMNYFTAREKISRKIIGMHSLNLPYSGMKILLAGIVIIL